MLADELGYYGVWAVEHYGLLEYSYCSAPEVLLAFIAPAPRNCYSGTESRSCRTVPPDPGR